VYKFIFKMLENRTL